MAEKNELLDVQIGASDRNRSGTPIAKSLIDRVALGMKYIVGSGSVESWFGPQQPLKPIAPADTAGRQFDFDQGFNLNTTPRKNEGIGFAQLRALADNCDIMRLVIETRKDQICRLDWSVKPKDAKAKPDKRCEEVQAFFSKPDLIHDFNEWLRMLLEDLLVLDAPTIYIRKTNGGKLHSLEPIDGATIAPLIDGHGRRPGAGEPAYVQQLKGMPAIHYKADELIYKPRNPRTHKVYGFSQVEQIVLTVQIALRRAMSQFDYQESGTIPDAIAGVPESWTAMQIKQFQEYFDTLMASDAKKKRSIRFLPKDSAGSFKEVKQPDQKSMYDEWLARIICYCFSVEVTPFVAQVNRATSETNREQSRTEGEVPLMKWVQSLMNGIIIAQFGYADVEFIWDEEKDIDPKTQADIDVAYIGAGVYGPEIVAQRLGIEREEVEPVEPAEPQLDAEGNPLPPALDAEGKPIVAPVALAPGVAPAGATGPDVQATALNGTQITSLQGIITAVIEKQMPPETAKALINAAFPMLSDEQIDNMLTPLKTFEAEVKAVPGFDEDGNPKAPVDGDGKAVPADDGEMDDEGKPKPKVKAPAGKVIPFKRNDHYGDIHIHIEAPVIDVAGPTINLGDDGK